MKMIHILRHYMKGIRLSVMVLAIMMTWAMLWGIFVYSKVQYLGADLEVLKSGDTDNATLLTYFPSAEDIKTGADREYAENMEAALEAEPIVETVFSIQVANPIRYNGNSISIVLYEPEMVAFFPGLKKKGIDFEADPDGCILGSQMFNALDTGDTINLTFSNKETAEFPVTGRVSSPYRRMTLAVSTTDPRAGTLFADGDAVIMQATDAVMEQINALAKRVEYDSNLIVVFTEDSTPQERERLLNGLAPDSRQCPLSTIVENSEEDVAVTLKEELPLPIFLAISAAVAYLSIVILTFQKKQKETAILYLCGGSRRKCALIHFVVYQIFALVPLLLNVIFILSWERMAWTYTDVYMLEIENFWARQVVHFLFKNAMAVNLSCLPVAFAYYIGAALISVAVLFGSMAGKTPTTYLRGASQ